MEDMDRLEMQRWYVVYSKPRKEEFALFHLWRKGLETFFPRLLLPHSSLTRQRIVPLFPNYLFVQLRAYEEYNYVRWSPGVRCVVNFNGTLIPIEDEIIRFLKQKANPEGILEAHSSLVAGKEVRIIGGPFEGLVGLIQNPPDARGRVRVLLELLGRQVKAEVPVRLLEGGWIVANEAESSVMI
jgi:transcription elongation factor/antiterminator RfaH